MTTNPKPQPGQAQPPEGYEIIFPETGSIGHGWLYKLKGRVRWLKWADGCEVEISDGYDCDFAQPITARPKPADPVAPRLARWKSRFVPLIPGNTGMEKDDEGGFIEYTDAARLEAEAEELRGLVREMADELEIWQVECRDEQNTARASRLRALLDRAREAGE